VNCPVTIVTASQIDLLNSAGN